MASNIKSDVENLAQYQVNSRREIVALLRAMQERNQLVSMSANGSAEAVVTSILYIDEDNNIVVVDKSPSVLANQRIIESDYVSFETVLDNIRVLFHTEKAHECLFDDMPALQIAIPGYVIRLQRREHYRIATPVATPLRCTIPIRHEDDGAMTTVSVTAKNISGGGIAIVDEKKLLDNTIGKVYKNCRFDLPGSGPVSVDLEVRNSRDLNLPSGRSVRQLGCRFMDMPKTMLAAVQRYITKLERERNAKATGMN